MRLNPSRSKGPILIYGSESEKWKHNPLIHHIRWLREPYYLEKLHYQDRPYPVASPAFSDVPLVGPLLAATIGKLVKPPVRMHEEEWDGSQYSLYSPRLEPRGPGALPPPLPKDEYSLGNAFKKEANISAEYTGLYGLVAKSAYLEETAFSPKRHLCEPLPPIRVILHHIQAYEPLAGSTYWLIAIAALAPFRSACRTPKLRHQVQTGYKTAPPEHGKLQERATWTMLATCFSSFPQGESLHAQDGIPIRCVIQSRA